MPLKLEPEKIYHISMQSSNNATLFDSEESYQRLLKRFAELCLPVFDTYAYCLTPEKAQWIVKIKSEEDVFDYLKSNARIPEETMDFDTYKTLSDATASLMDNLFCLQLRKQMNHFQQESAQDIKSSKTEKGNQVQLVTSSEELVSKDALKEAIVAMHQHPLSRLEGAQIENWKYSSYTAYFIDKPSAVKREQILELFGGKENFKVAHAFSPSKNTSVALN